MIFVSRQKKKQNQLCIPRKPRPQRWIPELRFGYPPLRNFSKSFWEKLGIFLESLGGSQRQLCTKTWLLMKDESSSISKDVGSHVTLSVSLPAPDFQACLSTPGKQVQEDGGGARVWVPSIALGWEGRISSPSPQRRALG